MNGEEFISLLSKKIGRDESEIERTVSSVVDIIVAGLQDGNSVSLQGLGVFDVKKKNEKIVYNPNTGKRTLYPPRLIVAFRPYTLFKERISHREEKSANG